MSVLASLFRIVLFVAPQDTEDLIEACILCVHHIVDYFIFVKHLPQALVETIGRWTACLLIDARNAEIGSLLPCIFTTRQLTFLQRY